MFTYADAVALAVDAHADQVDKVGAPYIFHPLRVAARLEDEHDRIVAVLHDVLEDTALTAEDLRGAGVAEDDVLAVVALTKVRNEPLDAYLGRVAAAGPRAVRVKRADMADNTDPDRVALLADPETADRLAAKYARCAAILDALAGPDPVTAAR